MSMRTHHPLGRARIALLTAVALLAQPLTPVMGQTPAPQTVAPRTATVPLPSTTAAQKTAAAAAAAKPATAGPAQAAAPVAAVLPWPRAYQSPSGSRILLYQPQVSEWSGQRHMVAYAAVSVEAPGSTKPALGTVKIEANTKVALDERLVNFSDMIAHRVELPDAHQGPDRATSSARSSKAIPDDDARHRARPRAGQRRQEPDPAEERRGRQGRPAGHLLQQDAGGAGEHRRRADLEPDQGERPEVRGQHELGPLPARADQRLLPAARRRRG